jgi:hypoxanthine phosphoribosyltransferase
MHDRPVTDGPAGHRHLPAGARIVVSEVEIEAALARLARDITTRLEGHRPIVMTVLHGGLIFAGHLLVRLPFPLDCDYVHVGRYGHATSGGELRWIAGPTLDVSDRCVLLLDDILDEGVTLAAIREHLLGRGAREVLIAAFAVKELPGGRRIQPDFAGVRVPNEFVCGFGMDADGGWRNLPAICVLPQHAPDASRRVGPPAA